MTTAQASARAVHSKHAQKVNTHSKYQASVELLVTLSTATSKGLLQVPTLLVLLALHSRKTIGTRQC